MHGRGIGHEHMHNKVLLEMTIYYKQFYYQLIVMCHARMIVYDYLKSPSPKEGCGHPMLLISKAQIFMA